MEGTIVGEETMIEGKRKQQHAQKEKRQLEMKNMVKAKMQGTKKTPTNLY